jgi:hypothetical protein
MIQSIHTVEETKGRDVIVYKKESLAVVVRNWMKSSSSYWNTWLHLLVVLWVFLDLMTCSSPSIAEQNTSNCVPSSIRFWHGQDR